MWKTVRTVQCMKNGITYLLQTPIICGIKPLFNIKLITPHRHTSISFNSVPFMIHNRTQGILVAHVAMNNACVGKIVECNPEISTELYHGISDDLLHNTYYTEEVLDDIHVIIPKK